MKKDEMRTLIEHKLLDSSFERHDAHHASNQIIEAVWPHVEAMREEATANERKANHAGESRAGTITSGNA